MLTLCFIICRVRTVEPYYNWKKLSKAGWRKEHWPDGKPTKRELASTHVLLYFLEEAASNVTVPPKGHQSHLRLE